MLQESSKKWEKKMGIEEVREQYIAYCERMKERDSEIQIIPFEEFKQAMKKLGGENE